MTEQQPGGPGPYTHIVKRESGYIAGWFVGEPPESFVAECNANVPGDPAHAEQIPGWPEDFAQRYPADGEKAPCGSDHQHPAHDGCPGLARTTIPYMCGDCGDEIEREAPHRHISDGTPQCMGREDAARRYPARFPQDAERYGIPMPAGTVQVRRDGIVQETFSDGDPVQNSNAAFIWLLRNQGQSVDWAVRHEGWEITRPAPCPDCGCHHEGTKTS